LSLLPTSEREERADSMGQVCARGVVSTQKTVAVHSFTCTHSSTFTDHPL
jgi:hypothetical protein